MCFKTFIKCSWQKNMKTLLPRSCLTGCQMLQILVCKSPALPAGCHWRGSACCRKWRSRNYISPDSVLDFLPERFQYKNNPNLLAKVTFNPEEVLKSIAHSGPLVEFPILLAKSDAAGKYFPLFACFVPEQYCWLDFQPLGRNISSRPDIKLHYIKLHYITLHYFYFLCEQIIF